MLAKIKFDLIDYTYSNTAIRIGIENIPTGIEYSNIIELHEYLIPKLLKLFNNAKINITSGYRCTQLNKAIGGSSTSQHCKGQAIDIQVQGYTTEQVYVSIKNSGILFDQLIQEFDSWVHISYLSKNNRKQKLRAIKINGKTIYKND
jgi:hypothetical protein